MVQGPRIAPLRDPCALSRLGSDRAELRCNRNVPSQDLRLRQFYRSADQSVLALFGFLMNIIRTDDPRAGETTRGSLIDARLACPSESGDSSIPNKSVR